MLEVLFVLHRGGGFVPAPTRFELWSGNVLVTLRSQQAAFTRAPKAYVWRERAATRPRRHAESSPEASKPPPHTGTGTYAPPFHALPLLCLFSAPLDGSGHFDLQQPCLLSIEVGRRVVRRPTGVQSRTRPTAETGEQPSLSSGWSDAPSV